MPVVGVNIVNKNLSLFGRKGNKEFIEGLQREADKVFEKSLQLVPVDTSVLKSTGRVSKPTKSSGTVYIDVSYGGGNAAAYAVRQHEDLNLKHKEGKQAKYLEQPAKEAQSGMADRIAQGINL